MLAASTWTARLLTTAGPASAAQTLSVWSCLNERLDLVCDWLGTQRLHNLLRTQWPEAAPVLRAGERVRLAEMVEVMPVRSKRDGLLGALLSVGEFHVGSAARAVLDELPRRLLPVLRVPCPRPSPDILHLPMDRLDRKGGLNEFYRRFYAEMLERHGGSIALTSQALGLPRQTVHGRIKRFGVRVRIQPGAFLAPRAPLPLELEPGALDLERRTCQLVLDRCRGDLVLAAILAGMTPAAWQAYLRALSVPIPAAARRPVRRRQA